GIRDPLVTGVQTCALPIFERIRSFVGFETSQRMKVGGVVVKGLLPDLLRRRRLAEGAPKSVKLVHHSVAHLKSTGSHAALEASRSEERRVGKEWRSQWSPR